MPRCLSPRKGCDYLRPLVVKERLESEFAYVAASHEAGRRYVLALIQQNRKTSRGRGSSVHNQHDERSDGRDNGALYVHFGDDLTSERMLLGMFVIPDEPLVFDYASPENEQAAAPLIARCAAVLDYEIAGD
jgi:hypothetical protein